MRRIGFLLVVMLVCLNVKAFATTTVVSGKVKDKVTGEPLAYVSVSFVGTDVGGLTDDNGNFRLETNEAADSVRIFMVGYKEVKEAVMPGSSKTMNVLLQEQSNTLDEISVSAKNTPRYRNKDNPAVELIRKVIDHKDRNYSKKIGAGYDEYQKLQVSLLRSVSDINANSSKTSTLARLFSRADTTKVPGKAALPVIVNEKLFRYENNNTASPAEPKLIDERKTSLDGIVDDEGLESYLSKIYAATDVYDNNIRLGDQQLLSPLAGMAPEFYRFYIIDTVVTDGKQVVHMSFFPRNKADLLFKGDLTIALETFAVTDAELTVGKGINLNWVDDLKITLNYLQGQSGRYYMSFSSLGMAMSIAGKGGGLYGEKIIAVKSIGSTGVSLPAADSHLSDNDWKQFQPVNQKFPEGNAYANLDTLKNIPSFKRSANLITLLLSGYEVLGPVEIGPINSFYSFNPVEGSRIRLGGRTTEAFSKVFMLEGHGAYGFRDKKWKYGTALTFSLTGRGVATFPMRNISIRKSFETQIPGQDLTFLEEDNFLLSFKRGDNDKWLYNDKFNLEYVHETRSHFTFKAGFTYSTQTPAGKLAFNAGLKEPYMKTWNDITLSEFSGEIRWAPHEQFYQGKKFRRPVFNSYPVFTLRGTVGVKGLMKSDYNYQSISLNIFKRFYLSQFGYSDVVLEGGKVFGQVPYPLLYIHKANQSYAYQLQSYNLMNFMEFVSDRYVSLSIDHSFNGFILNKIPLVKKLKLREVATFKALYGGLSEENTPGPGNGDVFNFPVNKRGNVMTHSLADGPYMEGSIGVANIFRILRIDVIKRFSYLDNPRVSSWGIRGRLVLAL